MLTPQAIIAAKRDGRELSSDEIALFVAGLVDGRISDAQVGAFAMAVLLRGMTVGETVDLTLAMRNSGRVLDWSDLPGPAVDKHSTGGIGDKVSLVLAPLLAACGAYVPMLSGRGLGHTGGTLDKLESIQGYEIAVDLGRLRRVVREAGCAIVGQTDELAPADRRLYAIRDTTATVESLPLITASILSKKLATAAQALVMDVKFGSGAFLPELSAARALARSITDVARGAGLHCTALLTDMNQCLGRAAGHTLEVKEALAMLRGEPADPRLREVTLALAREALALVGIDADPEAALASGQAADRFGRMVAALGGPGDFMERPMLAQAPVVMPVLPVDSSGYVQAIDLRAVGTAIVHLGGGRLTMGDTVDHAVGLDRIAGIGEAVGADRPLALVHARSEAAAERALLEIRAAFGIAQHPVAAGPAVLESILGRSLTGVRHPH